MAVLKVRLEWWKDEGSVSVPEIIDDWAKISIRIGSELRSNVMTIDINNPFGRNKRRKYGVSTTKKGGTGIQNFKVNDVLKCYVKNDTDNTGINFSADSNDLLFVGDIRPIKSTVDDNKSALQIKCTDRTFNLLNGLVTGDFASNDALATNEKNLVLRAEGWTAPLVIQHIIRYKTNVDGLAKVDSKFTYDRLGNSPPSDTESEVVLIDARLASEGTTDNPGFIQDDRTKILNRDGTQITRSDFGTPDTDTSLFPSGPIATRKHNFPLIRYVSISKPIYEVLKDLSQIEKTNTVDEIDPTVEESAFSPVIKRAMRFYIDEKNRFHWYYPADRTFGTGANTDSQDRFGNDLNIVMGTTDVFEVKTHSLTYDVFDVFNFVYFEAGLDFNGDVVISIYYDATSGSPIFKESKRSWPKIAEEMKNQDANAGNIVLNPSALGGFDLPVDTLYPFKPEWSTEQLTVNNDSEYQEEFRNEARRRGVNKAQKLIQGKQDPRWKGSIELTGHNFTVTDLIQYTSEDGGLNKEVMRINDVSHDISKGGWFTSLSVEADEKEITA